MSITLYCSRCGGELVYPGGLAFSPPNRSEEGDCAKYHVCVDCWNILERWLRRECQLSTRETGSRETGTYAFDADFSPDHETNKQAAKAHGLRFDRQRNVYVDSDGCPTRDRFGQPLG
jgi:hypothetical protein